MKKVILYISVLVFFVTLQSSICKAQEDDNSVDKKMEIETYVQENISYKSVNFYGENENWEVTLKVVKVEENNEIIPKVKLNLVPKKSAISWTSYTITTQNGWIKDNVWQIYKNPIEIMKDYPIPGASDDVVIAIKTEQEQYLDIIILKNDLPQDIISSKEAISIFVSEYYNIFGQYPEKTFDYQIEMVEGNWLVTFDDNDGIGGLGCLLVKGNTGGTDGIKIDE